MNQNGIDLQVCVEGRPIREFGCEGRTIVEGRKGVPFTIKIRNNHPVKVHASLLVDGVGVVSGNEKDLRGYILEPYSSYEVKGWRQSLNDVASFIFETKDGSYSKAVKGSDAQCGVISLVVHAEKAKPQPPKVIEKHVDHHHHHHHDHWIDTWPYRPYRPWYPPVIYCSTSGGSAGVGDNAVSYSASFSAGPTGSMGPSGTTGTSSGGSSGLLRSCNFVAQHGEASASVSVSGAEVTSFSVMNLGTGWGETQSDAVREVQWEDGQKLATMELFYTDAKGLKKLGIDVSKTPALPKTAGFPSGLTGTGFCQPPTFTYQGEPPTASAKPTKPKKKTPAKR